MSNHRMTFFSHSVGLALAALAIGHGSSASAQRIASDVPREMQGIEVIERLNEQVPLDLEFIDENGNVVKLGDFFEPGKPVILTLNYYSCPMLCHLTLNGMVEGLRDVQWTAGKEFRIVTITINPNETPQQATAFKSRYLDRYEREGAEWHFLCDKDDNVKKLAEAVGFGYRFVPETGEYAHSSVIKFLSPDGRIMRYMNDIMFEPRDLRFALVESSTGSIGSPMERLLLFTCFRYDPNSGSYVPAAWKIMRSGGALTVAIVAIGLFVLWMRGSIAERRSGRSSTCPNVEIASA